MARLGSAPRLRFGIWFGPGLKPGLRHGLGFRIEGVMVVRTKRLGHLSEELARARHRDVGREVGVAVGHELLDPRGQLRAFVLLVVPGCEKRREREQT